MNAMQWACLIASNAQSKRGFIGSLDTEIESGRAMEASIDRVTESRKSKLPSTIRATRELEIPTFDHFEVADAQSI